MKIKMKRLVGVFLPLCLMVFCLVSPVSAQTELTGKGTYADPYLIETPEQLVAFAESVNGGKNFAGEYVLQTADLDMEQVECQTIGLYDGDATFRGIYDGGGHTISNISVSTGGNNALFGKLGGTVMNLGIESGLISGGCVGAITSHASDTEAKIINCYNKATVNGARAGGIADNFNGSIANCWTDCELQSDEIGGIVSYAAASVYNCYSIADAEREEVFARSVEIIDEQSLDLYQMVDKLNTGIYRSATLNRLSYQYLNTWTVSEDGMQIVFSQEKASLEPAYFLQWAGAFVEYALPYLIIGVGCILLAVLFYTMKKSICTGKKENQN